MLLSSAVLRGSPDFVGLAPQDDKSVDACFEAFPDFVRESIPDQVRDRLSA
jgi:hypothetical protein